MVVLGMVVLGGIGVDGDERLGVLNVLGIRVAGDLAIGGENGFYYCIINPIFASCIVSAIKRNISEPHLEVEQFNIRLLQLFYRHAFV